MHQLSLESLEYSFVCFSMELRRNKHLSHFVYVDEKNRRFCVAPVVQCLMVGFVSSVWFIPMSFTLWTFHVVPSVKQITCKRLVGHQQTYIQILNHWAQKNPHRPSQCMWTQIIYFCSKSERRLQPALQRIGKRTFIWLIQALKISDPKIYEQWMIYDDSCFLAHLSQAQHEQNWCDLQV